MYSISFSAANVQYTVYHNVARQFVHCCKGDAASQWEMAILGMSELCNPWTDWLKIWHVIMLRSWPRMPNFIKFGGTRASRQYGEMYTSYFIYYIYFFTGDFTWTPLRVQNRIQVQMHPSMLVETTRVTEFEYYFTCTRQGIHLYSVMCPCKMIFAVLELWMSPLHWVLNWYVFNIYCC